MLSDGSCLACKTVAFALIVPYESLETARRSNTMLPGWTVRHGGSILLTTTTPPHEPKPCPTMAGNRTRARQLAEEKARRIAGKQHVRSETLGKAMVPDNLTVIPRDPRVNWYLVMLLDPTKWEEALAHGVRGVPDFYSHRNHIFVSRTVHELDSSNFDSEGKCTIVNRPSLRNHLSYSDNHGSSETFVIGNYHRAAGYIFLSPSDDGPRLPVEPFSGTWGTGERIFPTSGIIHCRGSSDSCKAIMASNPLADASTFQYPITPGANTVQFQVKLLGAVSGAGNVTLSVTGSTGASTTVVAVAVGDTTFSGTVTMNVLDDYITGFSITNGTGSAMQISGAEIACTVTTASSYTSLLSESIQNFDFAQTNLTAYRPVAGYCWVKYRGKLTANGSIAGALIDSATNPVLSRVSDYDTIAGLLHSYEGSLTNGNYSIWCPMNPKDTNYTTTDDQRSEAPYIAIGVDANDVDSQQIRVESFWVWEGLTQNQMLAPKPGSVDIEMMNDAFAKLAHFDKSMENDLHLRKIASFLTSGAKKGLQGIKQYLSDPTHRSSMISAAEQLASLGSTLSPSVSAAVQMALRALRAASG